MSMAHGEAPGAEASAALMDHIYRHQRHIYDVTRKHFLLGRDQLIHRLEPPAQGHVLEIGCGTGRNLIAAARAYPEAHLHGVDLSREMLSSASRNLRRAGLEDRVGLALADAATFAPQPLFGRTRFERAFFSYSLSMIPAWRQALAHAGDLLVAGGRLAVVDFGQQEGLPRQFRPLLHAWLAKFHVVPRATLRNEMEALAERLDGRARFEPLFRGYAWYAELRMPA